MMSDRLYNKGKNKALYYKDTQQYADSIRFAPDIVIIMFGMNGFPTILDAESSNAVHSAEDLFNAYQSLDSM